jgi:hypothetical protein
MSQVFGRKKNIYGTRSARQEVDGLALPFRRFDQQLMGKVNALSHLGDLHRGVRRWMIRLTIAADKDAAQQVEL